jgi:hypothetical protein
MVVILPANPLVVVATEVLIPDVVVATEPDKDPIDDDNDELNVEYPVVLVIST